jgi:hypothetical protein
MFILKIENLNIENKEYCIRILYFTFGKVKGVQTE